MSASIRTYKFVFPVRVYFVSYVQNYFEYNIKIQEVFVNNSPKIYIYINKIEKIITYEIKTRHYLELLKPEITKLLRNTKNNITKDKNDKYESQLEIIEVTLVHCNIVKNNNHQNLRIFFKFVPN